MQTVAYWICASILSVTIIASHVTSAQEHVTSAQENVKQIIQNRLAGMREIGTAFKSIRDELESTHPNLPKIQRSAKLIRDRGLDIVYWFPPGSEPPPKVSGGWFDRVLDLLSFSDIFTLSSTDESHAKLEIWSQHSEFEKTYREFEVESDKMWQSAQSGQVGAVRIQFKTLGKKCKRCHDTFREELD